MSSYADTRAGRGSFLVMFRLATLCSVPMLLAVLAGCGPGADEDAGDGAAAPARIVQHAMGSTEIPSEPQRIVVLDQTFVDAAFTLDTPLVGFTGIPGSGSGLPAYLGDARARLGEDAVFLGGIDEPNLEQVAALQPDLILSTKVEHEEIYDKLSAIAPTVFSETSGPTWKNNIRLLARSIGKESLAEERIGAYEQRAREIGDAIRAAEGRNPTVSVVRFLPSGTRLYQRDSFSGIVLDDTGLARPPSQDVNEFAVEISEERILDADADHIYVTITASDEAKQAQQRFTANPLWSQLTGEVFVVDDAVWGLATGLQGAQAMLDDLARTFGVAPE